ncbi:MAG: exodeoxyribonuclease VII small subunit [Thermodesulfobacteriaceae bacterium]|nr:exodeoxyribonuclease VII small subunit [Thermodesulfobacteriaceae bacterium]MCX8041209.1 exodeoxyribonuclease VII small subunit [Thermodesulfobacteriaceae bacterium]MDW8136345.1 exodeoxyribonuclease VII small subunit [Thermodesulfobacterium sp.]
MEEKREFLSLEKALKRVEEILKLLENPNLELEEALSLYEEGMNLILLCEEKLKKARVKVKVILKEKEEYQIESLEKALETLKNGKK